MAELEATPTDPDPIAHLHKMSATAGVAIQEYVAINNVAVAAMLVGLASSLLIVIDTWALLPLPAAAIILGILALRQIGRSNGTQSGRLLALGGMLVAALLTGAQGARQYMQWKAEQPERAAVHDTLREVTQAIVAGDFARAYEWFHPIYRSRVPQKEFAEYWQKYQEHPSLGKLKALETTGIIKLETQGDERYAATRVAATRVIIRFEKGSIFERAGVWFIKDPQRGRFLIVATDLHRPRPPNAPNDEPDDPNPAGPLGPSLPK